jgi:hypothetical protein
MSKTSSSSNIYVAKLVNLKNFILPQGEDLKSAVSALLRGSSILLALSSGFSAFLALGMFLSKTISEADVLRAALGLSLSGFGAMADLSGGSLFGLGSAGAVTFSIGIHSGLIALIGFWVIWMVSRRHSSRNETSYTTPIYLALGFTGLSWLIGFLIQGEISAGVGSISLKPMSITSAVLVFVFAWIAASRGQIASNVASAGRFGQLFYWIGRALSNYLVLYTVLDVIALIVLGIRSAIEPTYAYASDPVSLSSISLTPEQQTLVIYGLLLFVVNAFYQALFVTMGINAGFENFSSNSAFDFNQLAGSSVAPRSFWIYDSLGAPAFIGIALLVIVAALISGAAASSRHGIKFRSSKRYWQALGLGLLLSIGLAYITGVQASAEQIGSDGKTTSALLAFYGASLLSFIAMATLVISSAFLASEKAYSFIASGFPNLVIRLQGGSTLESRNLNGRVFGFTVKLLILAVIATPITASTIDRVSALTSGPNQLGEQIAKDIQTKAIQDLKLELNPTGSRAHTWFSDKVLGKTQPKETYNVNVKTVNYLNKDWQPGNLDAVVTVELANGSKKFYYSFDTSSEITHPSWLLTHVNYTPKLSPSSVTIQVNPQLSQDVVKGLTINGEVVKPGTYFGVPGAYAVKAGGSKLIAPTDNKFYASTGSVIKVGYGVTLPAGAAASLDNALVSKAQDCFKVSTSGTSTCFSTKDLNATISSGTEPTDAFDFTDSNFKSSSVICDGKRSDNLLSASSEKSSKNCSATVTFTRTYYKGSSKQVPNYVTNKTCEGGAFVYQHIRVSNGGDGYYYDSNGNIYYPEDITYDSCYYNSTTRYLDGYKTVSIRSSQIGTTTMTASSSRTFTVTGTLNANGSFSVKK